MATSMNPNAGCLPALAASLAFWIVVALIGWWLLR